LPIAFACALFTLTAACQNKDVNRVQPVTNVEVETMKDFEKRLGDYVALHKRIEDGLPAMPKEATPNQIDERQRDLLQRIAAARADAKQGDLFTPAMEKLVRDRFQQVFKNDSQGAAIKDSVMDENPVGMPIKVNQRYPDEVPLSTMPPDVLEFLPKMPEELEFRFVGQNLIIVDTHAHLIADFISNAIPK